MLCYVDKPYPTPRVEKKNLEYANILSFAYAGSVSEETAVHQYLYQSFTLDKEYGDILEKIAIVEMRHLDLLAQTIYLLGKEPKYETTTTEYQTISWNADYVPYPSTLSDMLKIDIEAETMAIRNYKADINKIDDPYIQELLRRIIEDEQLHLKIFEDLLAKTKEQ